MHNMDVECDYYRVNGIEDHGMAVMFHVYIYPSISSIVAMCILILSYVFINAYIKRKLKASKTLFYIGAIFFIICAIILVILTIQSITQCHNLRHHVILLNIFSQLYVLQGLLLLGQLYYRLYITFKETAFELRKSTNITFWTVYIITCILSISTGFTYANEHSIGALNTALAYVMFALLVFVLNGLFIYKLKKVNANMDKNGKRLIVVITKTTILAFVSTSITIFTAVPVVITAVYPSVYLSFTVSLSFTADIASNFLGIFLSFKHFHIYYMRCCGCCDSQCHHFCGKYTGKEDVEMMTNVSNLHQAKHVDSKSSADETHS
eukprot:118380_1